MITFHASPAPRLYECVTFGVSRPDPSGEADVRHLKFVTTDRQRHTPFAFQIAFRAPRSATAHSINATMLAPSPRRSPTIPVRSARDYAGPRALLGSDYDWVKVRVDTSRPTHALLMIPRSTWLDIHFIHSRSRIEDAAAADRHPWWPARSSSSSISSTPCTNPHFIRGAHRTLSHLVIPSLPLHCSPPSRPPPAWDPSRVARTWSV